MEPPVNRGEGRKKERKDEEREREEVLYSTREPRQAGGATHS
jgi:hypothetical protein